MAPERFGLLGSHGGGFLPREAVPRGTMPTLATVRDGGDFCGFIEGDGELWSAPDNAAVCAAIREMGGVELCVEINQCVGCTVISRRGRGRPGSVKR